MGKRNSHRRNRGNNKDKLLQFMDRLSDRTAIQPEERLRLETGADATTGRIIDLVTPIGKGQRVLLPSPPKAGKTTILQEISRALDELSPEVHQMALLIDERVEEVTDFERNVPAHVFASSIDQPPNKHVKTAESTFKQALNMVFQGKDVLILLDSLTRLARAYNKTVDSRGRTLSGGLSANALDRPRMLFGAARNIEGDGSLTVIASALVDTGSRMDEVIFQEFKGTGNCEIVLDRSIADRRIWPAVDITASGTRQERRLMNDIERKAVDHLRRKLAELDKREAIKYLKKMVEQTESNDALLRRIM
jgi:transcription termination factor Rho